MNKDEIYRIIDANLNRASEGLRVIEDGVRFLLNEKNLTLKTKELRHFLLRGVGRILGKDQGKLIAFRDVPGDVGALLKDENWVVWADLIKANFRRVEEAQRSLEEFSKLISPALSEHFKKVRFEVYLLDKEIQLKLNRKLDLGLYVITPPRSIPQGEFQEKVLQVIEGGAKVIQLREKSLTDFSFFQKAKALRKIIPPRVLYLINDRVDIAVASEADGVHLGGDDLPLSAARQILGDDKIIGISTHSLEEAEKAVREGADYIAVGSIFSSPTKPEAGPGRGVEIISLIKSRVNIPLVAVGGITLKNLEEVIKAKADGIALISAIFGQKDILGATREFTRRINKLRMKLHGENIFSSFRKH